ncbi:hypothetical protein ACFE04_020564 [Oxalis oulophora]
MAEWSTLPEDLLNLIGKRLESRWEAIRFRSVASSWRSSTPPIHCNFPIGFPVYITGFNHIHYFRLSRRTIFLIGLPENRGQWLVKAKEDANGKLHLINPFSLTRFPTVSKNFPNKLNLSDFRVLELSHQIVVEYDSHSREPQTGSRLAKGIWTTPLLWLSGKNNNDFALLMTYFHGKLFVYRSKDKSCIEVENKPNKDCLAAASFHGKFYAIDDLGKTLVIKPSRKSEFLPHDVSPKAIQRFLVTSGNELFLIDMFMFQVHKLDEERKQWIEVKTLEDRVLFIGKHGSFFAPISEFSSDHKGNCIIFREDIIYSTYQECNDLDGGPMHLFCLEDSCVKSLTSCASFTNLLYTPPNWIFNFA